MRALPPDLVRGLPAALESATESGLLEATRLRAATAWQHADALSLSPRAVELVLDVLVAVGLLHKDEAGRYGSSGDLAFPWQHVPNFLATGEPLPLIDRQEARGPTYAKVVDWLGDRFASAAHGLARELTPASRILDVGAGSGVWSLTMARMTGAERVIGLDLPEVLPRFLERAKAMGLADRAQGLSGSYFDVAPDAPVDRVVLAGVLHLEGPAAAALLVERAAAWLANDGEIVIVESLNDASFEINLCHALYALHLGLRTKRGGVYEEATLRAFCAHAGLTDIRAVSLHAEMPSLGALVARKP